MKAVRPTACAVCNEPLNVIHTGRVRYYCSQRCNRVANPPKSKATADRPTVCETCANPIRPATTGGIRRYCSPRCQPGRTGELVRRRKVLAIYGLSHEDHERMLHEQGGACAICGDVPERSLHVDHCHETGAVRGLLCSRCNTGLGLFADDPRRLSAAINYLTTMKESACLPSAC